MRQIAQFGALQLVNYVMQRKQIALRHAKETNRHIK